jgi:hypothetical protein
MGGKSDLRFHSFCNVNEKEAMLLFHHCKIKKNVNLNLWKGSPSPTPNSMTPKLTQIIEKMPSNRIRNPANNHE